MFKFFDKKFNNRGALTLEYVILITGVISVAALFLRPSGPFSEAINFSYSSVSNGMLEMSSHLAKSRDPIIPQAGIDTSKSQDGPIVTTTLWTTMQ